MDNKAIRETDHNGLVFKEKANKRPMIIKRKNIYMLYNSKGQFMPIVEKDIDDMIQILQEAKEKWN